VKGRAVCITFALLLFATSFSLSVASEEETILKAISLTVYFDGYVLVEYNLEVNPIVPAVNVTSLGQVMEDVTVVDQEGLPLDYSFLNGMIMVYSLGSEQITITYHTQDLTKKEGRYWTLEANTTTMTTVILPLDASIISLNKI
jgi:hypothetical protein